jgi:trimeric autotransporter adhesin
MAFITDATRKVVIDHAVATLGRAPSAAELAAITKLLNNNASLADVADYLTSSEGYLAKYPLGQTAKEVAADILDAAIVGGVLAADIRLAAIDLISGGLTAGTYTIASATNAVVAYLSDTANNDNADLGDIAKAFQNRTAAAEEFTTTFTLEGATVTEADLAAAVEGVTSDAATLTAAKAAFEAGNKSIAAQAAADAAAAQKVIDDAAAAKAAAQKVIDDAAAAQKVIDDAAAAQKVIDDAAAAQKVIDDAAAAQKVIDDAAAAEKVLTDASTKAAADAKAAIDAATAADAELIAAQTASEAAATKAALTDATALTAVTTDATTADTDAKAAVVTAQEAYDAALVAAVPADVVTKQGELLIAQNQAKLAAEALATAKTASDAATADDAAAATAATAYETALAASNTAAAAADAAAAAAVTAAAATADTDDDTAAAAQVTAAAASNATADKIAADAAEAKAADDKAAADAAAEKVLTDAVAAAKTTAETAVTDSATANTAAADAIAAITDNTTSAAALVKANAASTAATAATEAVAAYVAAAAKTADADDDTAADTLATTAATQATAATGYVTTATTEAATDRSAQTFTLTTNTDNIAGGAGDDSIISSSSTFNSDDIINGGAGNDSFSVAASGAATTIANLSNTELVKVTQGGAGNTDYALNMISSTGVENVMSRLSTGEVSFDNLQNLVGVHAFGTQSGAKVTATFLNALASGTADSVNLIMDGGANATFQVSGTTDTNEFETINLASNGTSANTVSIKDAGNNDPDGLKTYNVSGAAKLTQTLAGGATKATFDASTATGVQAVTWGGNYTTLKTGSAADTIVAAGSFFGSTNPKTVDGGDGTDTLAINASVTDLTSNTATQPHSVANIETLEIDGAVAATGVDTAITVEADLFSVGTILIDAENLDAVAGAGAAAGEDLTITVNDITNEAISISLNSAGVATNDGIIALNLKTDTGAADEINISTTNPTADTLTSITTLTVDRSAASVLNAVETVNLALGALGTTSLYGTTINALDAQYSTTLKLTGAGGLDLDSVELADPVGTATAVIDASGMSGKLKLDTGFKATASDTVTITLGSGTNSVDFAAEGLSADSVIGTTGAKDTVSLLEAAADTEMTITNIDTVKLTGAGASKKISAKKMTDVTTIAIYDRANNDTTTDNISVSNIAAGQAIEIYSTDADKADWKGGTVTLDLATGVTAGSIAIKGGVALEGTGVISSDIIAMDLAIGNKNATTGAYFDQTVVLSNTAVATPLTTLTLTGGGLASPTAYAKTTLTATNNVNISTLDATGYVGDLDITGATTKAGGSVTLGAGANTITVALADLARDALSIDGGDGADTLVAVDLAATLYRPGLTGIETLDIDLTTGTATELSLSDTTGVVTVALDLDSTDENFTVSGASSVSAYKLEAAAAATTDIITLGSGTTLAVTNVNATLGSANTSLVFPNATDLSIAVGKSESNADTAAIDLTTLTTAEATSITLGGTGVDAATGAEYIGAIDIATLVSAKLTGLTLDLDQGDITLGTVTAAKLASVTATGDNDLSFGASGGSTAALASFDASTATGTITIGQAIDFTSSASVKTGTANDTVTLDVLTEGNVTLDMGEKTSDNDNLKISGANNMGLTVVDLSAADQISQLNGAINGAVQAGVESIDLSGLSGSFGATVTGSDEINTIIGTSKADNIIAGKGADIITGGAGADTIAADAGNDTIVYKLTADLFTSKVITDGSVDGGDGTDVFEIGTTGTAFATLDDDVWTGITSVETIKSVANSAATKKSQLLTGLAFFVRGCFAVCGWFARCLVLV